MPKNSALMSGAVLLCALLVLATLSAVPGHADPHARIIDGRTIMLAGETYQLRFIRIPAPGADCRRAGRQQDCSAIARAQLIDITVGSPITCRRLPGGDQCRADRYDLSHGMVHAGWARSDHADLAPVQEQAERKGRGLWHPSWQGPDQWLD